MDASLTHGIALSIATGCALFFFGLAVGLVLAGVCWAFIADLGNREAEPPPMSSATISDEEIEIVIGLVRDALAEGGWALCGDCYSRQLLQQVPFPVRAWASGVPSSPTSHGAPSSTQRMNSGRHSTHMERAFSA